VFYLPPYLIIGKWERIMVLSWPILIAQVVVVGEWPTVEQTAGLSL
jgi:hypothetical protein